MVQQKKGRFSKKGKAILDFESPKSIEDLLTDQEDIRTDVHTQTRQPVNKEKRKDVNTSTRIDVSTDLRKEPKLKKTKKQRVRHELRLPYELSEKLRKYTFTNRTTKTATIEKALTIFLNGK